MKNITFSTPDGVYLINYNEADQTNPEATVIGWGANQVIHNLSLHNARKFESNSKTCRMVDLSRRDFTTRLRTYNLIRPAAITLQDRNSNWPPWYARRAALLAVSLKHITNKFKFVFSNIFQLFICICHQQPMPVLHADTMRVPRWFNQFRANAQLLESCPKIKAAP